MRVETIYNYIARYIIANVKCHLLASRGCCSVGCRRTVCLLRRGHLCLGLGLHLIYVYLICVIIILPYSCLKRR